MKRIISLCILLMLVGLTACQNPQVTSKTNKQDVQTSASSSQTDTIKATEVGTQKAQFSWNGKWTRPILFNEGTLKISSVTNDQFTFQLAAHNGGYTGEVKGKAKWHDQYAQYQDSECSIQFYLKTNIITIQATKECQYNSNNGVYYSGVYVQGYMPDLKTSLFGIGVFHDNTGESALKSMVGKEYSLFINSFQVVRDAKDLDPFQATIKIGSVNGSKMKQGIIMYDKYYNEWSAVIDGNQIKYYTNNQATHVLPLTIQHWMKPFSNLKIVGLQHYVSIPKSKTITDAQIVSLIAYAKSRYANVVEGFVKKFPTNHCNNDSITIKGEMYQFFCGINTMGELQKYLNAVYTKQHTYTLIKRLGIIVYHGYLLIPSMGYGDELEYSKAKIISKKVNGETMLVTLNAPSLVGDNPQMEQRTFELFYEDGIGWRVK